MCLCVLGKLGCVLGIFCDVLVFLDVFIGILRCFSVL